MNKVLDFIKSHTAALACAAVAVLALVAYFVYPIPSLFGTLREEVQARGEVYSALDKLNKEPRTLPPVDITAAEPAPLEVFPTDRVIKSGEEALQRLADQSNQTLGNLQKLNQRQLLVPNSLPSAPPLARQNFLTRYKAITQQYGEEAKSGLIATVLKGTLPPTEAEMRQIVEAEINRINKTDLTIDGTGREVNRAEVEQKIAERTAKLPLEQRVFRARNAQIYVSPGAVDVIQELLTTNNPPDPVMIFNAQFSLWVQTAVFEAIAAANAGSENVLTSPVKHLVRLDMLMLFVPPGGGGGGNPYFQPGEQPAEGAGPVELKPDPAAPITLNYARSPLGYTSNSMFDAIPVQLTLRVDSRRLPEVIAAMQGGQLLKIKNVNYRTVSLGRALQEGYVYDKDGTTPMVEVVMECDVLMLRSWLVPYMPEAVKRHFSSLSNPVAPQ